jgi:hypothetical protein
LSSRGVGRAYPHIKYLRQTNRMAVLLFHDAVFEHPTKETAVRTKLHRILQNNEVLKIVRGAVDDDLYGPQSNAGVERVRSAVLVRA